MVILWHCCEEPFYAPLFLVWIIHIIIKIWFRFPIGILYMILWLWHFVSLTEFAFVSMWKDHVFSTAAGLESCNRCAEGYLMENWRCVSSCSQGFYAVQPNSDSADTQSTCKRCLLQPLILSPFIIISYILILKVCVYVQVWCELSGLCRAR